MTIQHGALTYSVDGDDVITSVSKDWRVFALENAWPNGSEPDDVVGQKLWTFINGPETRHIYDHLFKCVRESGASAEIPFRCDSPTERRFLELSLVPSGDASLELTSTTVRIEPRSPLGLLDVAAARSEDLVRVCSACKKIAVSDVEWLEAEEALVHLRLFEAARVPQLTHGYCQSCYDEAMAAAIRTGEEDD